MRRVRAACVVGTIAGCCAGLQAQGTETAVIYRLSEETSTYQTGCFPPCLCPPGPEFNIRGTFKLTPAGSDLLFQYYDVSDVNWIVSSVEPKVRLTGSGTYKIGGEVALTQQLTLDLQTNDGPVEHFDSGLVPIETSFPGIAVTVSMNMMFCLDTVIHVDAQPVPPEQIQPYHLTDASTYQEGCFLFCDCILYPDWPLGGTFALVPLNINPLFSEFAVVNIDWHISSMTPNGKQDIPVTGVGTYWVGGEVAIQHEMNLDLFIGGDPQQSFHSNLIPGGTEFPDINIILTMNDYFCYDREFDLHAVPDLSTQIALANPPTDNPYVPGEQPFRDVLQTGSSNELTQGIGGALTPSEDEVSYSTIQATFSAPTQLAAEDISVACSYTGNPPGSTPCPTVTSVQQDVVGGFAVTLSGPIPPGGCAMLTFTNVVPSQQLRYESLPGDASMNGVTNTQDLLYLVQALNNGDALLPANLPRLNMNRSPGGVVNTQDLLRLVQLLNGSLSTQAWNAFGLVPCPTDTP